MRTETTRRRLFDSAVTALLLLASACDQASREEAASALNATSTVSSESSQKTIITRGGSQPSRQAPIENFTGSVRVEPLINASDPSRLSGARVTFEPGARSAWHTHPLGQNLIVTSGTGWVQQWGGRVEEIREGDVVWTPPGVKHWHGATATTSMSHIALVEQLDGKSVEWMEKVSDTQYGAPVQAQQSSPKQEVCETSRDR